MAVRPRTRRPLSADERRLVDGLVEKCGARLLAYVRRVHGSRLDAEDIVAETYCRAAANIEALGRCERPDLYLLTIARNLCRDRYRRPGEQSLDPQELDHPAGIAEPIDSTTSSEQRDALRNAVASLPETLREVVTLRLSTDLKFQEIADLLELPLGTVLSRMHTAMNRLKEELGCVHEH
jgi:RNA polymerase sigma-70 factor (ECF subfamily)